MLYILYGVIMGFLSFILITLKIFFSFYYLLQSYISLRKLRFHSLALKIKSGRTFSRRTFLRYFICSFFISFNSLSYWLKMQIFYTVTGKSYFRFNMQVGFFIIYIDHIKQIFWFLLFVSCAHNIQFLKFLNINWIKLFHVLMFLYSFCSKLH